MPKSVVGWILIIFGLAVIFWGLYSSYEIFTAKTEVPELFRAGEEEALPEEFLSEEEQMQNTIREQLEEFLPELEEFLPVDFIPRLFNLLAWSVFAMILFFGGGKTAEVGIKLLKS